MFSSVKGTLLGGPFLLKKLNNIGFSCLRVNLLPFWTLLSKW